MFLSLNYVYKEDDMKSEYQRFNIDLLRIYMRDLKSCLILNMNERKYRFSIILIIKLLSIAYL